MPLQEVIVGDMRVSLWMLLGAVGLVLLIACANVGNLLFARALARRKELAIRAALGAGRARVFQQLFVEALILALAGGVAGLLLARASLLAAATLLADQLPRADEISIDTTVLLFAAGVSMVTGVLAGALPALRAGRTDLNDALKEGGRHDGAVGMRYPAHPGRMRGGALGCPADGRGGDAAQPGRTAQRRRRLQCQQRPDDARGSA